MKKELLVLLAIFLPFTAWAELKYIGVGDLSYTINTETKNASVRGSSKTDLISVTIPSSILYEDVTYSVVGIEDMAFEGRAALTSVSLPSSLRVIGKYAFESCGITQVLIPGSVQTVENYAFANCSNLISFSLGGSMTLGMGAFKSCVRLNSVSIPEGSTLYGEVFSYCIGLTSVTIPKNITFSNDLFSQCTGLTSVRIENTTTGINTFAGCSSLTTVTFGPDARTIDKGCFNSCTGLTSFVVPNQIETINDGAFEGCTNLESLALGNGLVSVGNSFTGASIVMGCKKLSKVIIPDIASWCNVDFVTHYENDNNRDMFYYARLYSDENTEITHLVIPDGVSTIKKNVFMGCKNIESVTFSNSVEKIEAYAFNNCSNLTMLKLGSGLKTIAVEGCFEGCPKLTKVIIPDIAAYCNLTKGGYIFGTNEMHLYRDEATEMTDLLIPEGVTSIGEYLFYNFTGLISLTLPNSLESIGTYAFYNCKGLKTILVGKGLKSVATYSFFYYGDYSKSDFYILAATPPEAVYDTFTISFGNKYLHVPENSLEQYKAATAWKNFTSIVALQDGDPGYDELTGAVAFDDYKTQILDNAEACTLLISEAKTAISNLDYDKLKTLRENKEAVDALAGKLVHDIAELLGMVGDTNGDGRITIADAVGVVNIILSSGSSSAPKMDIKELEVVPE